MPTRDIALRASFETLFTVGVAEGRAWEVFGGVGDVAFDASERLYVLDRPNARVVVFDSTGRFVRQFGRRGGGPGELSAPQQMAITGAGEVAVSDVGRQALSFFRQDGTLRFGTQYPRGSVLVGHQLEPHPRGGVVSRAIGNPASRDAYAFGDEVILWYPGGSAAPRPLVSLVTARERRSGAGGGSLRMTSSPIFSPYPHFSVLPDGGLALADRVTYTVRILGPTGRAERTLERAIPPRRVTGRDREQELRRQQDELASAGSLRIVGPQSGTLPGPLRAAVSERLREERFATHMPAIRAMEVDRAGNLWLLRAGPALDRPGPIDVITPRGRYVGTISASQLPVAFSPGGRGAYVERDEEGVERVRVVRLPRFN